MNFLFRFCAFHCVCSCNVPGMYTIACLVMWFCNIQLIKHGLDLSLYCPTPIVMKINISQYRQIYCDQFFFWFYRPALLSALIGVHFRLIIDVILSWRLFGLMSQTHSLSHTLLCGHGHSFWVLCYPVCGSLHVLSPEGDLTGSCQSSYCHPLPCATVWYRPICPLWVIRSLCCFGC